MGKILSDEEIIKYGITAKHEIMDNGEIRFRLVGQDGSGYIRTEAGEIGAWQNSHFHKNIKELYIIQKGWMALACIVDGELALNVYYTDDFLTIQPGIVHNVYLPVGAITHTIKYGDTSKLDWHASPEFDAITKNISEREILKKGVRG